MKLRVIGFEGSRDEKSPVNWGTAAIADDEWLINAATGHRTPLDRIEDLVNEGHLTQFGDIEIDAKFAKLPLVVVELRRVDKTFSYLSADTGRLGGLVGKRAGRTYYQYVFDGQETFDAYAREIADKITHELLYEEKWEKALRSRLVRAGLVLAEHHPALNALRIAELPAGKSDQAREIAEDCLQSDEDREAFGDLLDALTADEDEDYVIKYEDGIAEGGGFDVDEGEKILRSARTTHVPFVKDLLRRYPYLSAPPPPRLHYLEASSAILHFTAHVKGRPLGERVARQLELRLLERSLRGEMPTGLGDQQRTKMERAIATLRSPTEGTHVSHVPIGGEEERLSVDPEKPRGKKIRYEPLTLLGYQSGLIKLADEIEIIVFPSVGKQFRTRLRLRTHDNGDGDEPLGVRPLQEGRRELLYQPMLFTIMRVIDGTGRETMHLRGVKQLDVKQQGTVNAIPSSIVDGAVMYGFDFKVRRVSRDRLTFDLGSIGGIDNATQAGAREWITAYAKPCTALEIEPKQRSVVRYWRPSRPPTPTPLQRILVILKQEGGSAHQSHLVGAINERFGGMQRTNNTRRAVIENPELLEFDEEDRQVICLTSAGLAMAAAFERAGGRTRRKPAKP